MKENDDGKMREVVNTRFTCEQGGSFTVNTVMFGTGVCPEGYQPPLTAQYHLNASQRKLLALIVPAMLIKAANPK